VGERAKGRPQVERGRFKFELRRQDQSFRLYGGGAQPFEPSASAPPSLGPAPNQLAPVRRSERSGGSLSGWLTLVRASKLRAAAAQLEHCARRHSGALCLCLASPRLEQAASTERSTCAAPRQRPASWLQQARQGSRPAKINRCNRLVWAAHWRWQRSGIAIASC